MMMRIRVYCWALAGTIGTIGLTGSAGAQTLEIVDNLPGMFTDISTIGTDLQLGDEDEAEITTTIGNAVFPAGSVWVARNGGLGFDPVSTDLAPINLEIPSSDAFGGSQAALAFWDDIGNDTGTVLWHEDFGSNTLIVQWHEVPFNDHSGTATFQVKIFGDPGAPPPIYAQFIYEDIEQSRGGGGASATIGYQDGAAGFNDVQWSYNAPGAVSDGDVLTLTEIPEPAAALLLLGALTVLRRR